jgi:peptide-methionine (S)-S-oxide reductase
MTSRFLSAGLAAAAVVGLAVGAWAQAGGRPGRGQPKPDDPATAQDRAPAAANAATGEAEAPFGSAEGTGTKDPFDEAAKAKGGGAKAGDSLGSTTPKLEKATFGAGCFWHVEAEFEWLPGVKSAVSGYAGGEVANPTYEMVHEGDTGHIEVVQVEYDPSVISYEQLLKVFWHGHDPTQWNRQGPDVGTQYRSAIFYHNEAQRKAALKSYRDLTAARAYRAPIVTLLLPMKAFYRAEEYHQNYYGGKPDMPVGRSSRARRAAAKAARKGTAAASRAAGVKKGTAASKAAGLQEGNDPAPAPGQQAPGAPDAEP